MSKYIPSNYDIFTRIGSVEASVGWVKPTTLAHILVGWHPTNIYPSAPKSHTAKPNVGRASARHPDRQSKAHPSQTVGYVVARTIPRLKPCVQAHTLPPAPLDVST
jgi:hypothetical protein